MSTVLNDSPECACMHGRSSEAGRAKECTDIGFASLRHALGLEPGHLRLRESELAQHLVCVL